MNPRPEHRTRTHGQQRNEMKVALALVALLASATTCGRSPRQIGNAEVTWHRATDLILHAFDDHPLVALSDGSGHGQLETRDFFNTLIRDDRFSSTVHNIVIEFGNARYQAVMDRYCAGESVTRDELRHAWEDTTQANETWLAPIYEQMLAEVRSVNERLPPERRIRVLLGDPPIDWSVVISPADDDMNDWRDAHAAHVIEQEVMRRHERSLILFGGAHLSRKVIFPNSLIHLLDSRFPGQTFVVEFPDWTRVDPEIKRRIQLPLRAGGISVRNTWLGKLDVQRIAFGLSNGLIEDDVDALVILTADPPHNQYATTIDAAYRIELARRQALARSTLPFRGAKIRFEENDAVLTPDAAEPLHAVLEELRRDPSLKLLVKAFADPAELYAPALSIQRAELVVAWLAQRGVEQDRLTPKGCGARRPLYFGHSAAERAVNRRAELVRLTATADCEPPW